VEAAARKHEAYKQAGPVLENRRCRRELTKRHAGSFSALLPRQETRVIRESGPQEIKDGMVGRAQLEWDYRHNVGSTLVNSLIIDDKMRVHEMSLEILKRGYQGFNIGFSELVWNETSWEDPKCLNKVWWFDSSTGVLFNGLKRLNEPQRRAVEVRHGQEKEKDDYSRGRFDEGDKLTLLLDLGYNENLGGLRKVYVNGQQVCAFEGVLGPVRLTV
jgi:hypothetical protein